MACKRSAVRARLAPPQLRWRISNTEPASYCPGRGNPRGKIRPQDGCMSSSRGKFDQVRPGEERFATFKRSPVAAGRTSERIELAAEPASVAWCRRGSGGGRLERKPRSYRDPGVRDRLDESSLCRDVSPDPKWCLSVCHGLPRTSDSAADGVPLLPVVGDVAGHESPGGRARRWIWLGTEPKASGWRRIWPWVSQNSRRAAPARSHARILA
jgi:hypothetical protein